VILFIDTSSQRKSRPAPGPGDRAAQADVCVRLKVCQGRRPAVGVVSSRRRDRVPEGTPGAREESKSRPPNALLTLAV